MIGSSAKPAPDGRVRIHHVALHAERERPAYRGSLSGRPRLGRSDGRGLRSGAGCITSRLGRRRRSGLLAAASSEERIHAAERDPERCRALEKPAPVDLVPDVVVDEVLGSIVARGHAAPFSEIPATVSPL
jgi:hypothetical protein